MASSESSHYSTEDSEDYYSEDYYQPEQEHSKADELPDPEQDRAAVFLGEFSTPVKATRGNTIDSLKGRLISSGICFRPGAILQKLCLDNLFTVSSSNRKPKYLTFDVPTGDLKDVEEQKVITLVEVLRPGLHSLSCYVEVPLTCSPAEFRQECQHQLSPGLQQEPHTIVLLWLSEAPSSSNAAITPVGEDEVIRGRELDDMRRQYAHKRLLVCWLPKPPVRRGKSDAPAQDSANYYSTQYVLLQHVQWNRRTSNCHLLPMNDGMEKGGAKHHKELQAELLNLLQREYRQPLYLYSPPSSQQLHFVRGNYTGHHNASRAASASFSKVGQPHWMCPDLVQHLYVEGAEGYGYHHYTLSSRDLDHPSQTRLAYELEAREDARIARDVLQRRVKLLRRLPLYDVVSELRLAARKTHTNYTFGLSRPSCAVKLTLECPNAAEPRRGVAHFKVYTWPTSAGYHGSLLSSSRSLSTAANAFLQSRILLDFYGGEDMVSDSGLSADDSDLGDIVVMPEWVRQLREGTLQVPQQFRPIFEAASSAAAPEQGAAGDSAGTPSAAASSDSTAPAAAADSMESPDIDPELIKAERLRRMCRSGNRNSFSLRMTLRMLNQHDNKLQEEYESWMDSMDAWWKAEKNMKGLLDVLKTGPCEAAPQPAGLSVTLHPHQQQTLFRLLALEYDPLGFSSILWTSFENNGQQWWTSLVLGRLSMQAPVPTATGGFLADEMGLGKTISILALILANPAPDEDLTLPQHKQQSAAEGAGAAMSSRQAALQSTEPIVTKPGERLPVLESTTGSSRQTAARSGGGTAGAGNKPGKQGSKGKQAGNKGKKRDRTAADSGAHEADAEDSAAADADTAAPASAAAEGSTRGRGWGRGRGRGKGKGRGSAANLPRPAVAVAAMQHLMQGNVKEAMEDIAKLEAVESAELDAAAALPSTVGTGLLYSRATLVVCAVSLVGQWMDEAMDKTQGCLRIFKYHGPSRDKATLRQLAADFDVVVTTYQTLVSDRSQHDQPPLEQIQWWRVVFDEGHVLKNPASVTTRTAVALTARNRWVVTGTPISNDVSDLSGQMAALQLWPFNTPSWFVENCKNPFMRHFIADPGNRTCSPLPLVHMLRQIMTRHTKDQELEGQAVLQLPNKTVTDVPVVLNTEETAVYKEVYGRVRNVWLTLAAAGPGTINKHILQAMSLLLPLRRICSGGRLTRSDMQVHDIDLSRAPHVPTSPLALAAAAAATSSLLTAGLPSAGVAAPDDEECVVCLDCLEVPVVTPCGHWFCKECIVSCLQTKHNCPLCRAQLAHKDLRAGAQPAVEAAAAEDWAAAAAGQQLGDILVCDSKLKVLLKELSAMRAHDPTSKALVFTQYNSTLEWLKKALPAAGFGYRSISGSMPLNQRTKAIEAFQRDPPTTVFLLSMRSGAVGINLTAASHVFLLEPCLNPALEEQAIGRAWRMGQKREVVVKRLFVKGSIEERIMALTESRRTGAHVPGTSRWATTAAAVAGGPSAAGSSAAAQLAGAIKADTQKLRAAELEGLFAPPTLPQPIPLLQRLPAGTAAAGADEAETGRAPAAIGAGPSNATTAAAVGYVEGSSAAAVAAAAAAAAVSSAAAALAAVADTTAVSDAQDLKIERQLALAGLLAGSKRAAAWADDIAAAAAGAARRSTAGRGTRRTRQSLPPVAAAMGGLEGDAGQEAADAVVASEGRCRRKPRRQQQLQMLQSTRPRARQLAAAQVHAININSNSDESEGSSSSDSDAGMRHRLRGVSRHQQQQQKQPDNSGSGNEDSECVDDGDSSSSESESAESERHLSDRRRRRSSSLGTAVGRALEWMAAAVGARGRQQTAASASDSESSESESLGEAVASQQVRSQRQQQERKATRGRGR